MLLARWCYCQQIPPLLSAQSEDRVRVPFSATLRSTPPRFSPIQQRGQEDTFLTTSWFCTRAVDLALRAHRLFGPRVLSSPRGFAKLRRLSLTGLAVSFLFFCRFIAVSPFQVPRVSTFRRLSLQLHGSQASVWHCLRVCSKSVCSSTTTTTHHPPHIHGHDHTNTNTRRLRQMGGYYYYGGP